MGSEVVALAIFLGLATAIAAAGMFARDMLMAFSVVQSRFQTGPQPVRLRRLPRVSQEAKSGSILTRFDNWFDRLVRETGWGASPATGVLLVGLCSLAAAGGMFVWTENPAAAGVAGVIGGVGAIAALVYKRSRHTRLLQTQFPGALEFMARNLRAGHSLDESIELIGEEGPKPLAAEFQYCSRQLAMGLGVAAAVRSMADRVGLPDTRVFATLLSIHREAGGNVAEVLERFAAAIREKLSYRRQLRAITSAGRMSAFLVGALGPLLFVYMFLFHTEYIQTMLQSPAGQTLLLGAAILEIIGLAWTARLMRPIY